VLIGRSRRKQTVEISTILGISPEKNLEKQHRMADKGGWTLEYMV
jgi:hypothetical protein